MPPSPSRSRSGSRRRSSRRCPSPFEEILRPPREALSFLLPRSASSSFSASSGSAPARPPRGPSPRDRRRAARAGLSASATGWTTRRRILLVVSAGVGWVLARRRTAAATRSSRSPRRGSSSPAASRDRLAPAPGGRVRVGCPPRHRVPRVHGLLLPRPRTRARLFTRATTDAVTNLPNRGTFLARSRDELFRAERTRRPLALVLLELDGFDALRTQKDSVAVDEVVAAYGQGIARAARGIDVPARWGTDTFAALLVEADEGSVRAAVERIRGSAAKAAGVTASAGISVRRPLEQPTIEDLVRRAAAALDDPTRDGARDRSAMETRGDAAAPSPRASPRQDVLRPGHQEIHRAPLNFRERKTYVHDLRRRRSVDREQRDLEPNGWRVLPVVSRDDLDRGASRRSAVLHLRQIRSAPTCHFGG